jgi:hypothetical protein
MTLADAVTALAQAGGRFVVEGGSISVDLPPGGPPVTWAVLATLRAHREMLTAVLVGTPPTFDEDERAAIVWAELRPNPEADQALAEVLEDWDELRGALR